MIKWIRRYKKLILPIGVGVLYCVFGALVFSVLHSNGLTVRSSALNSANFGIRLVQDISLGVVFPLALIIFCRAWGMRLKSFGLKPSSPPIILILAASCYVLLLILLEDKSFANVYLWFYYLIIVAASEEIVFRGFVFLRLYEAFGKSRKGAILACVISGAIWGIAHAILPAIIGDTPFFTLEGALSNIGGGILGTALFSFLLLKSQSLYVPIFFHAFLDFLDVFPH